MEKMKMQTQTHGDVKIKVSKGETINIGNYESSKIGISIELICSEKEIETKYEELQKWIKGKIKKETENIYDIKWRK